jgi:hypothetical protein
LGTEATTGQLYQPQMIGDGDCGEIGGMKIGRRNRSKYVSKDIPVTGHGSPWGCERLRLPHYLDKRLIDGGKVVSPTRRPHFTPTFLYS